MRIQPQIVSLQRKLRSKFADPSADPLEIMSTQQSLTRLQEELRNEAMANYLRKRALLTDNQQRQLETMMHQMVVERQAKLSPQTSQADEQNGLMNIIHKVKWAIEPH
jgi:glutaminase